jgi:hypothetical protein
MVFCKFTPMQTFFAAAQGQRPRIDLGGLPDEYRQLASLIEQCWHDEYKERVSAKEVVSTLLGLLQKLEHKCETPENVQTRSGTTTQPIMSPLAPAVDACVKLRETPV